MDGKNKLDWVDGVFASCQEFFDYIEREFCKTPKKCLIEDNAKKFKELLVEKYEKHSGCYKTELGYWAWEDAELDSHKRGACLFFALMDISPYENFEFANALFSLDIAYDHVHKDAAASRLAQNKNKELLKFFINPIRRKTEFAPKLIYEENRSYMDCLAYALHREYLLSASRTANYSVISLILFHYENIARLNFKITAEEDF